MTPEAIKQEAARRAMNEPGLSASQRKAFAAKVEADLRAEADAAAQAQSAAAEKAEASAERARVSGVIRVGADLGRARQAARLALTTALDASGAKALLSTLPTDMQATPEALAIPSEIGNFGTVATQVERRRIASILGHEAAGGRFQTATALAFSTGLDVTQAVAALLAVPRQEAQHYQSLEQRSRDAGEFGADLSGGAGRSQGERTTAMWSKAVAAANASIGAAPAPATDTPPANPFMNDAERAALSGAAGLAGAALADLGRG
ncbi:hypothetical protein H9N28_07175 [Rhodobacter capsulatus]|uniref:hypothetical protein n=2 Tax=Rhodobacter capsulatus TaxID=1061 RepID=UPI0006DCD011|nr:hypothetical protein [Rhodobacter capsulatus]KQB17105.1 hypothetical protein AP073_00210 [Rhodobacter capsulatus]KQB17503.1 hypothetical protein AP071_00215 [Rhodobacter capsulatus]PZX27525.1 hypothetical protein LY44_00901 [Rhodobacter capsulatus]QNR64596.1 hypothetical protein H9N28_07175 [Rhodobacter capsulatus]